MHQVTTRTRASTFAGIAALALIALGLVLPAFAPRSLIQDLFFILTMLTLAQLWNLIAGFGGMVSVGQQAFVGIGAYAMFAGVILWGWDPVPDPPRRPCRLPPGHPHGLLRLPPCGRLFRHRPWVIAEVTRLVVAQWKTLGGGTGTSLPREATADIIGVEAIATLFGLATPPPATCWPTGWRWCWPLERWPRSMRFCGRAPACALAAGARQRQCRAIGGGWTRDASNGSSSRAAAMTGLVGALIYMQTARISPDAAFSVTNWTAYVIFIAVIGGIGRLEGPILGVLVFWGLQTAFADYGSWYLLALGLLAIAPCCSPPAASGADRRPHGPCTLPGATAAGHRPAQGPPRLGPVRPGVTEPSLGGAIHFHFSGNMESNAAARAFATLGHPDRLAVFRLLMRFAPRGVRPTEIAAALDLRPNTLSHHLADLAAAGLVDARREGRSLYYVPALTRLRR